MRRFSPVSLPYEFHRSRSRHERSTRSSGSSSRRQDPGFVLWHGRGDSEGRVIILGGMQELGESNEATVRPRFAREVVRLRRARRAS